MHLLFYAAIAASLMLIAFAAAMLGIGGGTLFTPLQIFFGIDIREAAATSLFLTGVLSIGGTAVYCRAGKIDWALAVALNAAGSLGSFASGYLSGFVAQSTLVYVLAASLVLAGASMLHPDLALHHRVTKGCGRFLWKRETSEERYVVNLAVLLPLSFLAGSLAGLVGIGGGVIYVPMMVLFSGVPMDIAVATSGFMVGITALFGLAGHALAGHFHWGMGLFFALGVLPGAWFGARTMLCMEKRRLRIGFGLFMFLISIVLIVRQVVVENH